VFISENGNNRLSVFTKQGQFVRTLGRQGSEQGQFLHPWRISAENGLLYVGDADNRRIQVINCVTFDVVRTWAAGGTTGLCVKHGIVAACDLYTDTVSMWTIEGTLLRKFGSSGPGNGQFRQPTGVGLDEQHVFVVDRGNSRVQVFNHEGQFIRQFGSGGSGPGQFSQAHDVAVGGDFLYVGDASNRVQIFTKEGTFVSSWGVSGTAPGELTLPYTFGIDFEEQRLYIAEDGNHRVSVFE